jgi:pyrroloquinoline quinone (PQQ) biosynthesis protein C
MTPSTRLLTATHGEQQAFLQIPLVRRAVREGASRETYLAFLGQAYHHVKHTFPLLALADTLTTDTRYRKALAEYMSEELRHEERILSDIRAMGGDAEEVRASMPRLPCRILVGQAYYAIQWESPYTMLGMVHVLEGLSVLLAEKLATTLKHRFGASSEDGFSYLGSHGALDIEHTGMLADLLDGFEDPQIIEIVIEHVRIMYALYGAIFVDLDEIEARRAA